MAKTDRQRLCFCPSEDATTIGAREEVPRNQRGFVLDLTGFKNLSGLKRGNPFKGLKSFSDVQGMILIVVNSLPEAQGMN
jgi:hypothetical protein